VGGAAVFLARSFGCRVHGITLSARQVETCRRNAARYGVDHLTHFDRRDYLATGIADESFDVVWAVESVCYAFDKADFLREAIRLLRPGGRLVLADAISLADEEAPDYLITIATLTGAARVALGPDLPPLYSDDEDFASGLIASGRAVGDPLWRMPFWAPYDKMLKSSIADVSHIAEGSYAGSVVAALFLKRFVKEARRFAHLDIFAWVPREQPGRPQGGEPQAARALFDFFRRELGTS